MKTRIHFTERYLINPTNPIIINLIGAGGTGSQVLTSLARMHVSLLQLGHPGFFVRVFDGDVVTPANMGRQLFAGAELGLYKSQALINRINRFFGTNWKGFDYHFDSKRIIPAERKMQATINISCVDSANARFEIADLLKAQYCACTPYDIDRPIYWMDFGNGRDSGQVLLSTISIAAQPASNQYETVQSLPLITDEFKTLLEQQTTDDQPSCSMAEALEKQDLFINSTLAALGSSLLWKMFREAMTEYRGFFLNLKQYRCQPIPV